MDEEFRKQFVDAFGVELRSSVRRAFSLGRLVAEHVHGVQATLDTESSATRLLLEIAAGTATLRGSAAEARKDADVILAAIDSGRESDLDGQFAVNTRVNREAADKLTPDGICEDQEIARLVATIG